jgi:hypothetical protein
MWLEKKNHSAKTNANTVYERRSNKSRCFSFAARNKLLFFSYADLRDVTPHKRLLPISEFRPRGVQSVQGTTTKWWEYILNDIRILNVELPGMSVSMCIKWVQCNTCRSLLDMRQSTVNFSDYGCITAVFHHSQVSVRLLGNRDGKLLKGVVRNGAAETNSCERNCLFVSFPAF